MKKSLYALIFAVTAGASLQVASAATNPAQMALNMIGKGIVSAGLFKGLVFLDREISRPAPMGFKGEARLIIARFLEAWLTMISLGIVWS